MGGHGLRQCHDNSEGTFAARRRNEQGARQRVGGGGPYVCPAEYYQRALDSLSRLTEGPEPRRSSLLGDAAAFARVVLALGVRDRERAEVWRYLRRATASHRRNFAHAVTPAAMGYHLPQID